MGSKDKRKESKGKKPQPKGMFTLPAYEDLENKITTTLIDHRWVGQDLRMRFKLK